MISFKQIPGKGVGVVASRDFSPGEVILSDEVMLYCVRDNNSPSVNTNQARHLYQQYNRLSPQNKYRVSKLFCLGDKSILNIFSTNSFTITKKYCGLYVNISRINHSCDPNACYNNNGCTEKQVTAMRKIQVGEEITISYISSNWDIRQIRHEELSSWQFQCHCSVCCLKDRVFVENEDIRLKIKDMSETIAKFVIQLDKSLQMVFVDMDQDEDTKRNLNSSIVLKLKDTICLAEQRICLLSKLGHQLLLVKFTAHLDCLYLYMKARALNVLFGRELEYKLQQHGDIVTTMSDWNIDWRHQLSNVLARSYLLHVKWTYASVQ